MRLEQNFCMLDLGILLMKFLEKGPQQQLLVNKQLQGIPCFERLEFVNGNGNRCLDCLLPTYCCYQTLLLNFKLDNL